MVAGLLHRGGQVLKQTPAIGNFEGVRGGLLDRPGVGGGPVAADDLGTGMLAQPGRERLRGAAGQHVHDPAGFDVDQHGAIGAAHAESELIHPQHSRGAVRHCRRLEQSQKPGSARGQSQPVAQPRGRSVGRLDRDRPQPARQPDAGAAMPLGQPADLLDERPAETAPAVAEVPAYPEPDHEPARAQRPLIEGALIRAVHALRLLPAVRAPARATGGYRLHHQAAGGVAVHGTADRALKTAGIALRLTWLVFDVCGEGGERGAGLDRLQLGSGHDW